MRVGFLGPAGTYSQEAVFAGPGTENYEPVPLPSVDDAVMAVHEGRVERALVPIENSLEGAVNATLDTLAFETEDVADRRRARAPDPPLPDRARPGRARSDRGGDVAPAGRAASAPTFLRTRLPGAAVVDAASTADAVRIVAEREGGEPWAALGSRAAAELYGCAALASGVEDPPGPQTRFVWIAREAPDPRSGAPGRPR